MLRNTTINIERNGGILDYAAMKKCRRRSHRRLQDKVGTYCRAKYILTLSHVQVSECNCAMQNTLDEAANNPSIYNPA